MEKYSGLIAMGILLILLVVFIKYQANHMEEEDEEEIVAKPHVEQTSGSPLDLNDEDALVASLVASIELRNETHKNVQVISVRKVG